jgi:hypothetical protein
MKRAAIVMVALGFALALSATAVAQQVEYKVTVKAEVVTGSPTDHFVTFSGPVQIPEVTLPAGTYVFSLVAPSVVHVTSADRKMHYAMFFTAPIQRLDPAEDYEMTIVPTLATAPGRITTWFMPNQTNGLEFLYPPAGALGER